MGEYTIKPPRQGDVIVIQVGAGWVILEVMNLRWTTEEGVLRWTVQAVPGSAKSYYVDIAGAVVFYECLTTEFPRAIWEQASTMPELYQAYEKCTGV